jgi:hypothetical protein
MLSRPCTIATCALVTGLSDEPKRAIVRCPWAPRTGEQVSSGERGDRRAADVALDSTPGACMVAEGTAREAAFSELAVDMLGESRVSAAD